jgi:spermidine/putrescine-binding protein
MRQQDFTRRVFVQSLAGVAALAAAGRVPGVSAQDAQKLKLWAAVIHKVGAKDWTAMEKQAGIGIAYTTKSARADEAIQKMVVGDGNQLFDAMTDNGGGMEDALASQGAIVPLDTSKIPNWKNILPLYNEGGLGAHDADDLECGLHGLRLQGAGLPPG